MASAQRSALGSFGRMLFASFSMLLPSAFPHCKLALGYPSTARSSHYPLSEGLGTAPAMQSAILDVGDTGPRPGTSKLKHGLKKQIYTHIYTICCKMQPSNHIKPTKTPKGLRWPAPEQRSLGRPGSMLTRRSQTSQGNSAASDHLRGNSMMMQCPHGFIQFQHFKIITFTYI